MVVDARKLFTDAEKQQVTERLRQAESTTTAEIVCAVASESGRYDRAEGILGIFVALLFLAGLHAWHAGGPGSWGAATPLSLRLEMLVLCLGYIGGNLLGSYLPQLRTRLVGQLEMGEETVRAAWSVFCGQRLSSTRQRGGVLVYLSLFERRVVVLADQGAMEALGPAGVNAIRDAATSRLRQGKALEALLECLGVAGRLLGEKLPCSQGGGDNELSDELVILHPRP